MYQYDENNYMNNPYFRNTPTFPYAPSPTYEQVYPHFPSPPQYEIQNQEVTSASLQGSTPLISQPFSQDEYSYGYPLPYPLSAQSIPYQQDFGSYGQQQYSQQMSQTQQQYFQMPLGTQQQNYSQMMPHAQQQYYTQSVPPMHNPTSSQGSMSYGPFTPYPVKKKNQGKQPSSIGNFLSQFKGNDGGVDVNKMMNTAGTMVNTFSQLGGLAKQVGSFFIK